MIRGTPTTAAQAVAKQINQASPPLFLPAMELPAAKRQPSISITGSSLSGYSKASSTSYGDGYPAYRRQASSYSAPASQMSRSSTTRSSSSSFRVAARGVAGVFSGCFVPRVRKAKADEERETSLSHGSRSKSGNSHSQGSRSAGYHVSTDSGRGRDSSEVLTVADISNATSNFSEKNLVRQGGSGSVYRGTLKDGSQIAVKRARKLGGGRNLSTELGRDLGTLQKMEHPNLVRFLGSVEQKDETLMVFEHVDNGSLREHLDESRGTGLELAQRLNVAIDVAHAITYLHEHAGRAVIHRDIRSSNVLLTGALAAKVAGGLGFGLAAADGGGEGLDRAAAGYVDPEELLGAAQPTDKSDVYSLGVLLVELVTGRAPIERRRNLDPRDTTKWVRDLIGGARFLILLWRMDDCVTAAGYLDAMLGAGVAEVQGRGRGGGHGPEDEAEPGVGGGGGEDAGAGGAVRGAGEEGAAADAAVQGDPVDRAEGVPPEAGGAAAAGSTGRRRTQELRVGEPMIYARGAASSKGNS
ncbi:calmodulin-binding receptor-like cytoplasmic kinase 2 isoform X2 [Brachypodium distachyon]|uniref:calmodulin-binding receptor-like cytoplasmic kinase 2 isoform X2 n=1 Tax=Brachypodium distachyon TaxID=15368 RepID=UPI00071C3282|nr:calmodulin-binding receptor-like cytoplasmic kinase 2 isoform X2 [Brachypodium distachyon]|eukprot:XP_014752444.1 calmodulin-binding receptor-like cytoplasmic kinase 2 isoform X2 [Brachypodium distachyon]